MPIRVTCSQGRREGFMVEGGQAENLPPEKKLPPEIFFAEKVTGKIFLSQ